MRRPPGLTRHPLWALVLIGATGCGDAPAETPGALDLLARRPDRILEQAGELVPVAGRQWHGHGGSGWRREVLRAPDGSAYMETNQPSARLRLNAVEGLSGDVELDIWRTRGTEERPTIVEAALNGIVLGTLEVTDTPERARLVVPEDSGGSKLIWKPGDNWLELTVEPRADGDDLTWDGIALARVAYGPHMEVRYELGRHRARLGAATGLRYYVESQTGGQLEVRARSESSGELRLRFGSLDARKGTLAYAPESNLDLRIAGETRRRVPLPFETEGVHAVELVWSSPEGTALELSGLEIFEPAPRARPPIVFISIDTYAARNMGLYGYERANTPQLEALAEDAVVFERCVANAPWTLPSYLSVMTGLYPRSHYVPLERGSEVALQNWDIWQIAETRWTLAEALRARGYQTAAAVDTDWLQPRYRFDQGFDYYDTSAAQYAFDDPYFGIAFILEQLGPWLDRRDERSPFFLFLHALDAHGPFWPEAPFLETYAEDLPEDLRWVQAGAAHQTYGAIPIWMARTLEPIGELSESLPVESIVARYDETILKTDAYLGQLFERLKARGLYDDAVIVVTGDHGESFRHDFYSHGCMWEDILHVPLIIKLPGNEAGGTRVETSVQLVDLYPTLFELSGAGPPRDYLHGRSLLPLIRGNQENAPTFSEGGHIEQYMVEQDGWKLVEMFPGSNPAFPPPLVTHPRVPREWLALNFPELLEGPFTEELWQRYRSAGPGVFRAQLQELAQLVPGPYYELYDLESDPAELEDLAAERTDKLAELRVLLERERTRGELARADADARPVQVEMSAEELERLRALGYVGENDMPGD